MNKISIHRPNDKEFWRLLYIIRQFDIELTKAESDPKLKNLFWNLSFHFFCNSVKR